MTFIFDQDVMLMLLFIVLLFECVYWYLCTKDGVIWALPISFLLKYNIDVYQKKKKKLQHRWKDWSGCKSYDESKVDEV